MKYTLKNEKENPNSYLNKAKEDEPIFVLLGRDPIAPIAICQWILYRLKFRLNKINGAQIQSAMMVLKEMGIKMEFCKCETCKYRGPLAQTAGNDKPLTCPICGSNKIIFDNAV